MKSIRFMRTSTLMLGTLLLGTLVLGACNNTIKGDGNIISQDIPIENYNEIRVEGSADIVYEAKPGEATYLRIETDANIVPVMKIESQQNVLRIETRENINPTRGVHIYTNSPSLKYVENKGSSDIYLKGAVAGDNFKLDLRGSGDFKADNLVFATADFNLRGSGDLQLGGQVDKAKIEVSGNGDVKAFDMPTNSMECIIRGNGNLNVYALQELSIEIKGNGNIVYKGSPQITKQEIKGAGSVKMQ